MDRRGTCIVGLVLTAALSLSACGGGGEDPVPSPTTSTTTSASPSATATPSPTPTYDEAAEIAAAIAAFDRYWDEVLAVSNAATVPPDAFSTTATDPLRSDQLARLRRDKKAGLKRAGAPVFKDQAATVTGDAAVVVACVNEEGWAYVEPDSHPVRGKVGWRMIGRELTKVAGTWLVSDYSPDSARKSCPGGDQ